MKSLDHHWYNRTGISLLLRPLSWLFCAVVALRRGAYRFGLRHQTRLPVPVVVVGNITVGGTGKTPLVIWLAHYLRTAGYRPGIISRGYGGRARHWPQQVRADSDPYVVGDEAVVIARRTRCPMAVGPLRVEAAHALLAHHDCDIILSDDGMQHYALGRDVEIAVVDGVRRFGNGFCLPAGPLREPVSRLASVDMIVTNGLAAQDEHRMLYHGRQVCRLDEAGERQLEEFIGEQVHAVAGVGNPERFFAQLKGQGLRIIEHAFDDHHAYQPADLDFGDALPVIMTEKDAVKCRRFAATHHWYLPIEAELQPAFGQQLLSLLETCNHG